MDKDEILTSAFGLVLAKTLRENGFQVLDTEEKFLPSGNKMIHSVSIESLEATFEVTITKLKEE